MFDIINRLCGLPVVGPLFILLMLMGGVLVFALATSFALVAIGVVGFVLFFAAVASFFLPIDSDQRGKRYDLPPDR